METVETIKDKIRQYVIETTYVSPDQVQDDSLIFSEGIFDSMGFVLLINFIEETFNFKAKDSELLEDNFESINAIWISQLGEMISVIMCSRQRALGERHASDLRGVIGSYA